MRTELFVFHEMIGGAEHEFSVAYDAGRSILSSTQRVGVLERFASFETGPDTNYFLKAGVIHRIVVTSTPCVTSLTTMERHVPILSYGPQDETPFQRRFVNPNEADQIAAILKLL